MDNMDIYDIYDDTARTIDFKFNPEALRLEWTTKEGANIFIEDMTTSHIEAIMRGDLAGKFAVGTQSQARLEIELSIRRRLGI